jgi:hypothetical protein
VVQDGEETIVAACVTGGYRYQVPQTHMVYDAQMTIRALRPADEIVRLEVVTREVYEEMVRCKDNYPKIWDVIDTDPDYLALMAESPNNVAIIFNEMRIRELKKLGVRLHFFD